jgi:hypothetical protein
LGAIDQHTQVFKFGPDREHTRAVGTVQFARKQLLAAGQRLQVFHPLDRHVGIPSLLLDHAALASLPSRPFLAIKRQSELVPGLASVSSRVQCQVELSKVTKFPHLYRSLIPRELEATTTTVTERMSDAQLATIIARGIEGGLESCGAG